MVKPNEKRKDESAQAFFEFGVWVRLALEKGNAMDMAL